MKKSLSALLSALLLAAALPAALAENTIIMGNPATEATQSANAEVYQLLDFADEREKEFATRGLIAAPESLVITDDSGTVIFSQQAYDFVRDQEAPASANPSLWRNTQLNAYYGLFKVTDDIYQVRGYDISNMTFVRSEHGWIIMDCMSSGVTAKAALELFESEMGEANIVAIIISHAHVDHYGGIEGVISAEDAADPIRRCRWRSRLPPVRRQSLCRKALKTR